MTDGDVVNLAREGDGPFAPMAEFLSSGELKRLSPKLVIWEIPERYLVQPDDTTWTAPSQTARNKTMQEVTT